MCPHGTLVKLPHANLGGSSFKVPVWRPINRWLTISGVAATHRDLPARSFAIHLDLRPKSGFKMFQINKQYINVYHILDSFPDPFKEAVRKQKGGWGEFAWIFPQKVWSKLDNGALPRPWPFAWCKATDLPGQTMHWILRKTMPSSMSGALCFRQVQFISLEVPSSKLYLGHGFTGVAMVPRSNYSRALVSLCVGLATWS
jgi:hypothetical protein